MGDRQIVETDLLFLDEFGLATFGIPELPGNRLLKHSVRPGKKRALVERESKHGNQGNQERSGCDSTGNRIDQGSNENASKTQGGDCQSGSVTDDKPKCLLE